MAARVGSRPLQLAATNNIKKLDSNTDRERTGKQQKVQVHAKLLNHSQPLTFLTLL